MSNCGCRPLTVHNGRVHYTNMLHLTYMQLPTVKYSLSERCSQLSANWWLWSFWQLMLAGIFVCLTTAHSLSSNSSARTTRPKSIACLAPLVIILLHLFLEKETEGGYILWLACINGSAELAPLVSIELMGLTRKTTKDRQTCPVYDNIQFGTSGFTCSKLFASLPQDA